MKSKKDIVLREIEKAVNKIDDVINTQHKLIKAFSSVEQLLSLKKVLLLVKSKLENGRIFFKIIMRR